MVDPQPGDRITEGILWRGIGSVPGRSDPYVVRAGVTIFNDEAFWDRMDRHPDPQQSVLRSQKPSFLLASLCENQPPVGLAQLRAVRPETEMLAGLEITEVLRAAQVPSSDFHPDPGKVGPVVPALEVVFEPENLVPAHVVVTPKPEFHPRKTHDRIRKILAELATQYHARHGWVLPPATA